jgi:hypothetical protein
MQCRKAEASITFAELYDSKLLFEQRVPFSVEAQGLARKHVSS